MFLFRRSGYIYIYIYIYGISCRQYRNILPTPLGKSQYQIVNDNDNINKQWAERQTLPSPGMMVLLPLQRQHYHVEHQWQPSESKIGWPYADCSITQEPICLTNERAHEPQAPKVSTHKEEK